MLLVAVAGILIVVVVVGAEGLQIVIAFVLRVVVRRMTSMRVLGAVRAAAAGHGVEGVGSLEVGQLVRVADGARREVDVVRHEVGKQKHGARIRLLQRVKSTSSSL